MNRQQTVSPSPSLAGHIHLRIMLITAVSVMVTALLCTWVSYSAFREEIFASLEISTKLISDIPMLEDEHQLASYARELSEENIRLTLIAKDGSVLFDNVAELSDLDNHLNREEIEEAQKSGASRSIRKSGTIGRSTFYYAVRLHNGRILRAARETRSVFGIFFHVTPYLMLVIVLVLALCYFLSRIITERIIQPIRALNLDSRLTSSSLSYREIDPIIERLSKEHQTVLDNARIRQEFTANVSHELKTPLTAISGYAQLIETGMATGDDITKFCSEIHRSADRLLTLINDIIRLSELDAMADADTRKEMVDLHDIAVTCADMLDQICISNQVSIEVKGEKTLIRADRTMIDELVYNLCDNAIRYNRPGGHVWMSTRDRSITVRDDGIGIPQQYQERIFERFFRVDKSRSKKTGGTGLGLAIVKHIVEYHHAQLTVTSAEGTGTEITVRFPE